VELLSVDYNPNKVPVNWSIVLFLVELLPVDYYQMIELLYIKY